MEVINKINQIVSELDELDSYFPNLVSNLSQLDLKTQDLLHYIENNTMDAAKSCKIVKTLKEIRKDRRNVKNNMELIKVFNTHKNKLIHEDNRKLLLSELNKVNKQLNYEYRYRVFSEDDIKVIK